MITQTVTVTEKDASNIIIGRRGTYATEQIVFDLGYLIENFGDGTAVLMVKRLKDSAAYPPSGTVQDGDKLVWTVNDTDTSYKGHGECELFWYVDGGLAKTVIWSVTVLRDIGDTQIDPPDPYESWIDTLTELGAETLANAQAAAQSEANAEESERKAKESEENTAESERNAKESERNAEESKGAAAGSAVLSESWAVGGTGTRPGEDSNNSKHWAEVAQQGAEESGYAWFDVHDEDGLMYVTITPNLAEDVSFLVNESVGTLEVYYG